LSEGFSQSNLEELDLTGNQLATLPAEMLQMSALSLLVLVGNPLLRYFPRIIAKKTGTTVKV
jgi:Leucine-rich repeat (LRR) protein